MQLITDTGKASGIKTKANSSWRVSGRDQIPLCLGPFSTASITPPE